MREPCTPCIQGLRDKKLVVDNSHFVQVCPSIEHQSEIKENFCTDDSLKKGRAGRPRIKSVKDKSDWHYHLGGLRHSRCEVFLGSNMHYNFPLTGKLN